MIVCRYHGDGGDAVWPAAATLRDCWSQRDRQHEVKDTANALTTNGMP